MTAQRMNDEGKSPDDGNSKDKVFVSHSRRDTEGIAFFNSFFTSYGIKGFNYEFEGPQPPHSVTISEEIRGSRSVFVLLSPELVTAATSAWIGYEIGVALKLNKNIWAFENPLRSAESPVPHVSAYIQREASATRETFPFNRIAGVAGMQPPSKIESQDGEKLEDFICPNPNCKEEYFIYLLHNFFRCPICRKMIDYHNHTVVDEKDLGNKIQRPFSSRYEKRLDGEMR